MSKGKTKPLVPKAEQVAEYLAEVMIADDSGGDAPDDAGGADAPDDAAKEEEGKEEEGKEEEGKEEGGE